MNGAAFEKSLRVLLVEDSEILAQRLGEAIDHVRGVHLVGTASTEGVAIAASREVDIVILDLHLKKGTGFGVMRALSGLKRKPVIIVLTNYDLDEYKRAALDLGASYFLDKARDSGRIPDLLQAICRERATVH